MSDPNTGFGIIVFLTVIAGLIMGELKSRQKQPIQPDKPVQKAKKHKIENNLNEFEEDDIDRDVDEMPDDSLIYDVFN